jgi:4-hydroxybenzoate polyprenyltransferase
MRSKYYRLLRPIAWITFLLPFTLGFGLGITSDDIIFQVIFAFIAFTAWMSFSFIVNAITDIDVDKFHNGRSKDMNLVLQPLVTGDISKKQASYIGIIFLIISLIFAWMVNLLFFLSILIVDIVGYVYSMPPTRFKAKPIGDILSNSIAGGVIFIAGLSIGGANMNPLVIIGAFIMTSIFYIPTVVTDFEFDKKAGLKTSAVYFSPKVILKTMYPLTIILVGIGFFILITENIELQLIAMLVILYTIPSTIIVNTKIKEGKLNIHENWILIPFLLISLIFIIYGIVKLLNIFTL